MKFKNHFKQWAVSFKIYADFECNVKRVSDRNNNTSYTEKYQAHIPCSFAYKLFALMLNSINQFFFTQEKMRLTDSLK